MDEISTLGIRIDSKQNHLKDIGGMLHSGRSNTVQDAASDLCSPINKCCDNSMTTQLLERTMTELHESLSFYLARWVNEMNSIRSGLTTLLNNSVKHFRQHLDNCLCLLTTEVNNTKSMNSSTPQSNCTQRRVLHHFRTFYAHLQQYMYISSLFLMEDGGEGRIGNMTKFSMVETTVDDISISVDNLIIQTLIDASCHMANDSTQQEEGGVGGSTLKDFNDRIRCHKYCQARMDIILDSVATGLVASPYRGHEYSHANLQKGIQLLYNSDLLTSIRLHRIMMRTLDVAISVTEGLTKFNGAQGNCIERLMRMHRCALCAGETLTRPCPELCTTILSICLKPLSEMHHAWNQVTDSLKLVAQTVRDYPQLSLENQFNELPRNLISYVYELLNTHKDWLQPQCIGTILVLEHLKLSQCPSQNQASGSWNPTTEHQTFFFSIQHKMDQLANLWKDIGRSLCSESPHLATTTRNNQCWNGTARGRFLFEKCDFCGTSDETIKQTQSLLHPTQLHQQQTQLPFQNHLPVDTNLYYGAYSLTKPHSYEEQKRESATRTANELLVTASRDFHQLAETIKHIIQLYKSLQKSSGSSNAIPDTGSFESWVQLPHDASSQLKPNPHGNIWGWEETTPRDRDINKLKPNKVEPAAPNNSNADSLGQSETLEGSAYPSDWFALYQRPLQPPHSPEHPVQHPVIGMEQNQWGHYPADSNDYEMGSGVYMDPRGVLPPFLHYADYPHLNIFQQLVPSQTIQPIHRNNQDQRHPSKSVTEITIPTSVSDLTEGPHLIQPKMKNVGNHCTALMKCSFIRWILIGFWLLSV